MRLSLPPRYGICPSALLWRADVPIELKICYLVLYALAWRNDYRYLDATVEELATLFDGLEPTPVTGAIMRRRLDSLIAHGLIERKRVGRRYLTYLLLRHDESAPQRKPMSTAEQLDRHLIQGRPGKESAADRFIYEVLDGAGVQYEAQYHPTGCPFWYDAYLPDQNLLIELDSEYWHHGERAKAKGTEEKDSRKEGWATEHGLELIRIPIHDLRQNSHRTELAEQILGLAHREVTDPQTSLSQSITERPIKNRVDYVVVDETETVQQQQYCNGGDVDRIQRNEELLRGMGLLGDVVKRLAAEEQVTPEYLEAVMEFRAREAAQGRILGTGWVVKCVGEGWEIPERQGGEPHDRYRYVQGKYKEFVRR